LNPGLICRDKAPNALFCDSRYWDLSVDCRTLENYLRSDFDV